MKSLEINMCKIGLFIFSTSFEEHFLNFFYKVHNLAGFFFFFYDLGGFVSYLRIISLT